MEVSMVSRVGDRDVVRTQPFVQVKMALAAGHTTGRDYPAFDPLDVFAEDGAAVTATTGLIYGAKVESEVSFRTVDFPMETASFEERSGLSADEVESVVRATGAVLSEGAVQVAALHYVDPERFGQTLGGPINASFGVRIVPENVSVAARMPLDGDMSAAFSEDIIPGRADKPIIVVFKENGYGEALAGGMAAAIATLLEVPTLKEGSVLRVGVETKGDVNRILRASVYLRGSHIMTIAVDDREQYVPATEPEISSDVAAAFDDTPPVARVRGDLPSVYDGIYRAAYSYGMSAAMTKTLVKLLAADVDFQSRVNPADRIECFFSQPDDQDSASEDSELLYVKSTFGGNTRTFYRFQMADGAVDYFDEDGRSAKQFLLRNPVPNGKFRSGFGARRHPILGYIRMHTGVDWSAPRGTPIIASGNGTVETAGWSGGYGRQTIIRHANGYETSYNHQSGIARGIVPGARVRQGQVIGYVGSTGLATGDHLHYELMVNGVKVDPMRVRLPVGRVLKGEELVAFMKERERVDTLLREEAVDSLKVAEASAR
ncbi:MAG: M23 family metallopeptidase, partial [Mesorhizobium sp.]|nr:M23 family metallopeptidase [Mesorhizobium sp.]